MADAEEDIGLKEEASCNVDDRCKEEVDKGKEEFIELHYLQWNGLMDENSDVVVDSNTKTVDALWQYSYPAH